MSAYFKNIILYSVKLFFYLFFILVILFTFIFTTELGSSFFLKSLLNKYCNDHILSIRGSFLNGIHLDKCLLSNDDYYLKASGIEIKFQWHYLLKNTLYLDNLIANDIHIYIKNNPRHINVIKQNNDYKKYLSLLKKLPIDIQANNCVIKRIKFFSLLTESSNISLINLNASFLINNRKPEFVIKTLNILHNSINTNINGKGHIHMDNLFPFDLTLNINGFIRQPIDYDSYNCEFLRNNKWSKLTILINSYGDLSRPLIDTYFYNSNLKILCQLDLLPLQDLPINSFNFEINSRLDNRKILTMSVSRNVIENTDHRRLEKISSMVKINQLTFSNKCFTKIKDRLSISSNINLTAELIDESILNFLKFNIILDDNSILKNNFLRGNISGNIKFNKILLNNIGFYKLNSIPNETINIDNAILHSYIELGKNKIKIDGNWYSNIGNITIDGLFLQKNYLNNNLPSFYCIKSNLNGNLDHHIGSINLDLIPEFKNTFKPISSKIYFFGSLSEKITDYNREKSWTLNISLSEFNLNFCHIKNNKTIKLRIVHNDNKMNFAWHIGDFCLCFTDLNKNQFSFIHILSEGEDSSFVTKGSLDSYIPLHIFRYINPDSISSDTNKINFNADQKFYTDWCLLYQDGFSGHINILNSQNKHIINFIISSLNKYQSEIRLISNIENDDIGFLKLNISNILMDRSLGNISFSLDENAFGCVNINLRDLSLFNSFTNAGIQIGGNLKVNSTLNNANHGNLDVDGDVFGTDIRFICIDEGIRLVNGNLNAKFIKDKLIINSLKFPSLSRMIPYESRIRDLVTKTIKNGFIELIGELEFGNGIGQFTMSAIKFPLIQRSDRYSIVSGNIVINKFLKKVTINGNLIADAGWISLEILRGIPKLDDDIILNDNSIIENNLTTKFIVNLNLDVGKNFYATGLGLDTNLLGNIHIMSKEDGRLIGVGSLSTRDGLIGIYGQKLNLKRGKLTFQGRLDNPLLDIEALRIGELVEAGVRVSGTLHMPKIDIISYPDVSDVQKLSWLVFGRGIENIDSDAALLISIGSAIIGSGQPFYKQLGLNDLSVKNGLIGVSNSLLPDHTVASNINCDSFGNLATQFLIASKRFANGVYLSIEQAISGNEVVVRLSYKLSKKIAIDIKAGYIKGIALVYSNFFDD